MLAGTYFTAIMFMVASSCVTTIMILNYHHRMADTHEMPDWVAVVFLQVHTYAYTVQCLEIYFKEYQKYYDTTIIIQKIYVSSEYELPGYLFA